MFRRRPFIFGIGIAPNATGALTASAAVGRRAGCSSLSLPRPIARRLAARGMLRPTRAQRKRRRIVRFAVGSLGFGRRPFSCARWQRCHIRKAPFVLTQYGWFSLSQRSDAKSPGAEALGLLFVSGLDATVSGVPFFSMEPVATDDVFEADPGGFPPQPFGTPVQKKVMKPRIISLRRASSCQPGSYRGVGFGRRLF